MQDAGDFDDGGLEKSKKPTEVREARRCEMDAVVALTRRVSTPFLEAQNNKERKRTIIYRRAGTVEWMLICP